MVGEVLLPRALAVIECHPMMMLPMMTMMMMMMIKMPMLVMVIMMVTTISVVASQWNAGPECFSFKLQYLFADMKIFITTMVTQVVDISLTICKAK